MKVKSAFFIIFIQIVLLEDCVKDLNFIYIITN
jgi:hypothetical protein